MKFIFPIFRNKKNYPTIEIDNFYFLTNVLHITLDVIQYNIFVRV